MNFYRFLFILFTLSACGAKQQIVKDIPVEMQNIPCPDSGNCSLEVFKNSSLEIKTDHLGKLYPEIKSGEHMVIKYHFEKKVNKNISDANYSEFIYFEIDKNDTQIVLKDKELQNVKMLFGRICFCRDASGYFRVNNGNFYLFNRNNTLQFNLKFEINKVPQVITQIKESIRY